MKIHVNQVPAEGLRERATYDPTAMDMGRADIHLTAPFTVDAFVTKVDEELVVQADIRCPLELDCARCLERFPSTVRTEGVFSYPAHPGDVVDITDDVRQEIILAYPMVPVCRPDCKGLCSTCGQTLNVSACRHHAAADRRQDDWSPGGSIAV